MTCLTPPTTFASLLDTIDACVVSLTGIADWTPLALTGALVLLVPLVVALVVRVWR